MAGSDSVGIDTLFVVLNFLYVESSVSHSQILLSSTEFLNLWVCDYKFIISRWSIE
jgi:hypothetical protein